MGILVAALLLQSTLPPLPVLKLDAFPTAARDAIARAQREAAADPDHAEPVGRFARTLHAWEQWEAAHQVYQRLQRLDPRSVEWHHLDGVVLQRLASHEPAAQRFRHALTIAPDFLPARVRLAEALLEAGRLDESESLFNLLVKEPAAEPVAEYSLGRIAAARGQRDSAVRHLERAVTLFPQFAAAHYALARVYRQVGRAADAQQALERHQEFGAQWPAIEDAVLAKVTALRSDPRAQLQRGVKLAERGDAAAAIEAFEAALAADPALTAAHSNLVSLYGKAGEWAKAEEHYRAVVASGVNLADAHYDYGVLLGMQQKWAAAEEAYRKAIAVNPLHAQARNNLGQILERDRRLEEAAREYRDAIGAQPGFRLARFNLGRMLIALGRTADAIAEFERLTEPRDEEAPRYLFGLSVAYVRAGRKDEGIKWAAEARELAQRFGQYELAAAIERDLARLQ